MIFYLFSILIFCVILIYQYLALARIYFSNVAIENFRELRHEAIMFLSKDVKNLNSINDADQYNELLKVVNFTIENFDTIKQTVISFKTFRHFIFIAVQSTRKMESIHSSEDAKLNEFKGKLAKCLFESFRTIPMFRVRVLLLLMRLIAVVIVPFGYIKIKNFISNLEKYESIERGNVSSIDSDHQQLCL